MKIGVFSDVHGHLNELNQTLQLFKLLNVDKLICGGDLADKGEHSDAVVTMMRELAIPCVQVITTKKRNSCGSLTSNPSKVAQWSILASYQHL